MSCCGGNGKSNKNKKTSFSILIIVFLIVSFIVALLAIFEGAG